jgi:hypothetical protein
MTHKEQDVADQRNEVQHTANNALPHPLVYQIVCSQNEQWAGHEPAKRRNMLSDVRTLPWDSWLYTQQLTTLRPCLCAQLLTTRFPQY